MPKIGTMAPRACPRQQANCTLIARPGLWAAADRKALPMLSAVSCGYIVERVTESNPHYQLGNPTDRAP